MKNLLFLSFLEQSFFTHSANKRVKNSMITDLKLTVEISGEVEQHKHLLTQNIPLRSSDNVTREIFVPLKKYK